MKPLLAAPVFSYVDAGLDQHDKEPWTGLLIGVRAG
ncbi:hypothetical protein YSA_00633 [Pseudomonas putida ND6]|uniref:Uncharacterized protein n=1 Tax=Pseudomonas putida ND6 TaxID=231023 RepID=I3UNP4_PSEPU|nr:hypothetical protein YSA_00633 [Pseudomonas putida ND6]